MKKALCIALLFIYSVSVSGMVFQQRFCGGELFDSGVAGTLDDCCVKEEMPDCKKNCCLEKSEWVKVETAHEKPGSTENLKVLPVIIDLPQLASSSFPLTSPTLNFVGFQHLPQKIPLRLLFSVFRI